MLPAAEVWRKFLLWLFRNKAQNHRGDGVASLSGLLHLFPIGLELSAGSQLSRYCILTPFMFQSRIKETEKTGLACMHPPPSRYYRFSLKFMPWDVCQNPARVLELGTLPKCPEQYFVLAHLVAWHYCNKCVTAVPDTVPCHRRGTASQNLPLCPRCCEVEGLRLHAQLWHFKASFQRVAVALRTMSCSVWKSLLYFI